MELGGERGGERERKTKQGKGLANCERRLDRRPLAAVFGLDNNFVWSWLGTTAKSRTMPPSFETSLCRRIEDSKCAAGLLSGPGL